LIFNVKLNLTIFHFSIKSKATTSNKEAMSQQKLLKIEPHVLEEF